MAYPGVLNDIRAAVSLGAPSRTPVFAVSEPFDVRLAGLTYGEYTRDPETMARCRIEAIKKLDYDWSCGWPDDYLEFEPLGLKLQSDGSVPLAPRTYPEPTPEFVSRLKLPSFRAAGRMPDFLAVLKRVKAEFADTVCVTGRVAAPFTAAALLFGMEPALLLPRESPEVFTGLMEFLTGLAVEWGKAQVQAGADALWIGDCVASSGFISPDNYQRWALDPARQVIKELKAAGALTFYHAGESSPERLVRMAGAQPDALSVGGKISLAAARTAVSDQVCLMGNIRGIEILERGSPEIVEQETRRIMEEGKAGCGYIFNSEEGIPYETPEENMRTMMRAARLYGAAIQRRFEHD